MTSPSTLNLSLKKIFSRICVAKFFMTKFSIHCLYLNSKKKKINNPLFHQIPQKNAEKYILDKNK